MWYNCVNSSTTYEVFTANKTEGWVAFNLLVSSISVSRGGLY